MGLAIGPLVDQKGLLRDLPAAPPPSRAYLFANELPQPVNTDRWYYRVFQSAPDLIRSLPSGLRRSALPF